jgi:hypothetical protein
MAWLSWVDRRSPKQKSGLEEEAPTPILKIPAGYGTPKHIRKNVKTKDPNPLLAELPVHLIPCQGPGCFWMVDWGMSCLYHHHGAHGSQPMWGQPDTLSPSPPSLPQTTSLSLSVGTHVAARGLGVVFPGSLKHLM